MYILRVAVESAGIRVVRMEHGGRWPDFCVAVGMTEIATHGNSLYALIEGAKNNTLYPVKQSV